MSASVRIGSAICAVALLGFAARKLRDETYLLGGPAKGKDAADESTPGGTA